MIPRENSLGSHAAAFTRTELVFTLLAVAVITSLLTACASKTSRQNEITRCKDNLKTISLALSLWLEDNDANWLPWHLSNRTVDASDPRRSECWFQMMSLSNQLGSPKVLVDPADKGARVAKTWDADPRSGLGAVGYRDKACSYAIALDGVGSFTGPGPLVTNSPAVLLDRHLGGKSSPEHCRSTGIASTGFEIPFDLWWQQGMHGVDTGNMALVDGTADTWSASQMQYLLRANADHLCWLNPVAHVLFPKRPQSPTSRSKGPEKN